MNVLILDNQTSQIETLARGLRMKGYGVFAATNAVDALVYLRDAGPTIDLIITDDATVLPSAELLIHQIGDAGRQLPVIMMTQGKAVGHNINPLCEVCTALLEKPFDMATLIHTVESCMKACSIPDHDPYATS